MFHGVVRERSVSVLSLVRSHASWTMGMEIRMGVRRALVGQRGGRRLGVLM